MSFTSRGPSRSKNKPAYKAKKKKKVETGEKIEREHPIVNWFPGHMAKATRMIEEYIKKVDIVIELVDARIPISSTNPIIGELIGNKPHIIILNKSDLADPWTTKAWIKYFKEKGIRAIAIDSKKSTGRGLLLGSIEELAAPILKKWMDKGIRSRSIRTIILGIPNVGKSTLINALAKTAATRTANKPGHTKGQQWVTIGKGIELLDTPGVLWPKLEDQRAAARLAATGAISDEVYDMESVVKQLISWLLHKNPALLEERYNLKDLSADADLGDILEDIGRRRGCLQAGGVVNLEKARRLILMDYRAGKLGCLSFDTIEEVEEKLRAQEAKNAEDAKVAEEAKNDDRAMEALEQGTDNAEE